MVELGADGKVEAGRVGALDRALRAGALSARQAAEFDRRRAWPIGAGRSSWLGRELLRGNRLAGDRAAGNGWRRTAAHGA